MRLRCRFGIHLIDWEGRYEDDDGVCVYCQQVFENDWSGTTNITKQDRAREKRQAKIDNARDQETT